MLSLHTNAASLSAQNSLSRTQSSLSTSMTRLSTGYRINSSMDDAAGLQIATRLKAQTSGMAVAMRNTQNSTSMLQTADGALGEVSNILVRMKDLSTQAADASSTSDDKDAMQSEFDALGNELNNIMKNTTFGGKALLSGGTIASSMTFQIGASSTEQMTLDLSAGGTVGSMADLDTALGNVTAKYATPGNTAGTELASATTAMDNIKAALDKLGATRSALGGAANRLDHVFNNLSNISTNTQNATGRIMDVDFATESSSMTSNQMLMQAGTAMLKQTNSMSSMVMSLLQ